MKPMSNTICRWIAVVTIGLPAVILGCRPKAAPAYRFERQAAAVMRVPGATFSRSPQVGLAPSGALFVLGVYGDEDKSQLGLAISHDGGDTFLPPEPVSDPNVLVRTGGENSPSLAVTSTAIYAQWERTNPGGGSDVMFARSSSPGQPFGKPIPLADKKTPSFTGFSSLAVAPNGNVYSVWLDGRTPGEMRGTFSVYLARSTDRGMSFGANVQVATGSCPCCRPRITFGSNGEVYVFWRKVFHGSIRDIVVSTSNDGGSNFAPPVRVSQDNWTINGCPESGPAAAVLGHRLYVAWMTETDQHRAGVKLSWSDDGGKSFAPAVMASRDLLDANHPSLAAVDGTKLILVFQGRDPKKNEGWAELRPYAVEINDAGKLSAPVMVPVESGSISYPVVAADTAGRVFIAWTASAGNTNQIMMSRGRRM